MRLHRLTVACIALGVLIATSNPSQAQKRRPSGVASLAEMKCEQTGGNTAPFGSGYLAMNQDVAIGRQSLRAIAVLGATYMLGSGGGILAKEPTQVVCSLTPPTASSPFKTLILRFGVAGKADGALMMRLSVYKDGNLYGSQTFGHGELVPWPIDIAGTRSIALEAECLRSANNYECPNIIFFEDTLKK
ncbi:hypothetical protein NIES2100_32730 [Calothrix sp. NIES-2100]|uniref:hypothetical protein n=1 Tax=Calothrix sp. NIES-2100 TaxID=1954172 RepID=UPI000B609A5D|nr:hypothetical protein NIES2100_32730 [Calothrix sp. NIES-2100]